MLLLKTAFGIIGACGIAYAGYTYKSIAELQDFRLKTEKVLVEINTKLDIALQDIEYHHRNGDVKVQH